MNAVKSLAAVLLIAGVLALAYGGFTYTRNTHEAKLGPLSMTVQNRRTVAIPIWAGVAAVILGGALLLVPASKS
ncbi:MAG TPA: hypothetical protein VIJ16_06720 [Gemmatimonadaceae bacterium]